MSKIHKTIHTYKGSFVNRDILRENIYPHLVQDREVLLTYLSKYHSLEFVKIGSSLRCESNAAITIFKGRSGYAVKDFKGITFADKGVDLRGLIFQHNKNEEYEVLAELGILSTSGTPSRKVRKLARKVQNFSEGPKEHKLKKKADVCALASLDSELAFNLLEYFYTKCGADKLTLERYGIKAVKESYTSKGKTYKYSINNFMICYDNSTFIKFKKPAQHGNKKLLFQYQIKHGAYCFGLEQLLKAKDSNVKRVVICGGEDDAICLNEHLNTFGIYAICLSSEVSKIDDSIHAQINKFNVSVLYDFDKKGIESGAALADSRGYTLIKLAPYLFDTKEGNDVCDIFKDCGRDRAKFARKMLSIINAHTRINQYDDDKFSIGVNHAHLIKGRQYLGEERALGNGFYSPLESVKNLIQYNDKLILNGGAGTGKSTLIEKLFSSAHYLDKIGLDSVIIIFPTTAIQDQLYNEVRLKGEKNDYAVGYINGTVKAVDREAAQQSRTVLTTFDSLKQLEQKIRAERVLLIVDEYDQLVRSAGFRDTATETVLDAMDLAQKVLLLSATPNYLFTTNLHKRFNYKLAIFEAEIQNTIHIEPIILNGAKAKALDYILENTADAKETVCIKLNDTNANNSAFRHLSNRGIKADSFNSKGRKRKELNANYNSIMESGRPTEKLDYLFYTDLMESGVSFKFAVELVAISDTSSWSGIVQLCTRPRLQPNGTNSEVKAWLFYDNKQLEKEQSEEYKLEYSNLPNVQNRFIRLYAAAERDARLCNKILAKLVKDSPSDAPILERYQEAVKMKFERASSDVNTKFIKAVERDEKIVYEANLNQVLFRCYEEETKSTPLDILLKRIERFDKKRFTFSEYSTAPEHDEKTELQELIKASKDISKEAAKDFRALVEDSPMDVIAAWCYLSKNKLKKEKLAECFNLPIIPKDAIIEFVEENAEAFKATPKTKSNNLKALESTFKNTLDDLVNEAGRAYNGLSIKARNDKAMRERGPELRAVALKEATRVLANETNTTITLKFDRRIQKRRAKKASTLSATESLENSINLEIKKATSRKMLEKKRYLKKLESQGKPAEVLKRYAANELNAAEMQKIVNRAESKYLSGAKSSSVRASVYRFKTLYDLKDNRVKHKGKTIVKYAVFELEADKSTPKG